MASTLRWIGFGLMGVFALAAVIVVIGFSWLRLELRAAYRPAEPTTTASIASYSREDHAPRTETPAQRRTAFDIAAISTPNPQTRPWTRYWWPGGDIDAARVCRELALLDRRGFGGVEIQPFSAGLADIKDRDTLNRINSFGDGKFYTELSRVMDCAEQLNLDIYLNHLSGWPAGGPQVRLEDGLHSFAMADFDIRGGRKIRKKLPAPKPSLNAFVLGLAEIFTDVVKADFPADDAAFASAVAMRKLGGARTANPLDATDAIHLDPASAIVLDEHIEDGVLVWDAPAGQWTVIVTYILPSGEAPTLIAQGDAGYVIDHLRKDHVIGHYNWAYGARTGLDAHYGRAFKGFFNDSLEFKVDRMATQDILEEFEKRRGYDLRPHLPVVMVDAIDNFFIRDVAGLHATPRYRLTDDDERIRRDYQQTLSDLIVERFIENSASWAQARGLKSRAQSYGMDLDVIRALGANHVPETEQLYAGGAIAFLKTASSAGALYARPVISAESFVWGFKDYAVAPRQLKAGVDVLFAAGVNQVVYHGTPYEPEGDAYAEKFGDIPWQPFSGPGNFSHVSGNFGPQGTSWDALAALNAYIARSQNLLQSGRPDIDVFIYYPWLGFPSYFDKTPGLTDGFLYRGFMPDEPAPAEATGALDPANIPFVTAPPREPDPRVAWLGEVARLTAELDQRGVTWAWINDHALQTRPARSGRKGAADINAVVIVDTEEIELETARALEKLASDGVALQFMGRRPDRQPGYFDKAERNRSVGKLIEKLARKRNITDTEALAERIAPATRMTQSGEIKRVARVLETGERIEFFVNLSVKPAIASIATDVDGSVGSYWFDPMSGRAWPAEPGPDGAFSLSLEPLESRVLLQSTRSPTLASPPLSVTAAGAEEYSLSDTEWTISAGDSHFRFAGAFPDARAMDGFRHHEGEFVYAASFTANTHDTDDTLVLDLGRVEGTARVRLNGRDVATSSMPPHMVDLSDYATPGENMLEVRVSPPRRNELVGRALSKDPHASHMKDYADQLAPAGLLGPVSLFIGAE